jgi:hypothetical protein
LRAAPSTADPEFTTPRIGHQAATLMALVTGSSARRTGSATRPGQRTPAVSLQDLEAGARFFLALPGFLRHPVTTDEAQAALRRRFARRELDFLAVIRTAVYGNEASPYRRLLDLAGCEYGDLEQLVHRDGVEEALRTLYHAGVYLTIEEFKGRRPVVRGGVAISFDPLRLRNPNATLHLIAHSTGSGGARTAVVIDFAALRDRAVNSHLIFQARGAGEWTHSNWAAPGPPVGTLKLLAAGARMTHRFFLVDPRTPGLHAGFRWTQRLLRLCGRLVGVPTPSARYAPIDDSRPILQWIETVRRAGRIPSLFGLVTPVVRLSQAARLAGIDLEGVQLSVTGEPFTAARAAEIQRSGARVVPTFGSMEAGGDISDGCLAPAAPDDLHFFHDLHALIQPDVAEAPGGLPPKALLLTSLRPTAPFVLLNVSMGDQADVRRRACGCALEELGWTTHLQHVRSFEKLTASGMTFLDADIIRVLDEALPAQFGGGPTDYQLAEDEAADGNPVLRLLVHPRVGALDVRAVREAFLAAIGGGSGGERVMALQWQRADILRVERIAPRIAASGKVLHLHRRASTPLAAATSHRSSPK